MVGEELDKQMLEVTEKLKKRDEADLKKSEKEFRASMAKDTAGHVLKITRITQNQLSDLQAQIDSANPLVPVIRAIGEISVKMTEMMAQQDAVEQRIVALEGGASE